MGKLKEVFTSWKVILLILFLIASAVSINPKLHTEGVVVTSVAGNSSADINGITTGLKISALNGQPVLDINGFRALERAILPNATIKITTDKGEISFLSEFDNVTNTTSIGFDVASIPKSNIKQGLDLVGGVRVLMKPETQLNMQQLSDVIAITQKRLNAFGLQDISVKSVSDFSGNTYILVEMAGATQQQAAKLIAQQGKFEAKIGNDTVFVGGTDIKQVCRSADCSGVRDCNQIEGGWACQFQFKVDVSPESAKRHADITRNMSVITVGTNVYLEKKLDLYLDNELVESLYISEGLKGVESTSFVIEGPGSGTTKDAAILNALTSMKTLQTVLITGALPVKLDVVKTDIISPALGAQFLKYAIIAVIGAIAAVGVVIFARYRKPHIAGMVFLTGLSEVVIILGIAALIRWNLDLAGIAGLIAAVGTGVDAQIIITDEFLAGAAQIVGGWKERAKRAFFIIFGSFATVVAAMIPLYVLGATLLKGFAIITIIGVSIGVFVTRPAYAKMLEILLK
jgi:preprotein translocase subunit SecD